MPVTPILSLISFPLLLLVVSIILIVVLVKHFKK